MSPALADRLTDLFLVLMIGGAWIALLIVYFEDLSARTDRKGKK